ncbi:MAG: hypothetical protein J6S79_07775 [Lachnospiraceae bacterium]|nr:hypothetical protein [Lachnospiraceae bacterium]
MKMPFKKSIYRDVFERTRSLRIGFFLFSAVLTVYAYRVADTEVYAPYHARLAVWPMVLLAVSFAIFQEVRVHAFHRKKKWEWFYTIPFDKAEWYWTTEVAGITNLAILILVMSLEEYVACLIQVKASGLSQIGMPFVRQAIYAFAAGVLFMALLGVIRELTHETTSFFFLLVMTLATVYLSLEMVEGFAAAFTKGFGDLKVYWPTRFCLTERAAMGFDPEMIDDVAIVYDSFAILGAILIACGLSVLGRKLADASRAEYVGAESRNKRLFVVFGSISLLLTFQLLAFVILDSGFSAYCLLFLLLSALVIYLFCRILKERSVRRIGRCILTAALGFAVLIGVSGLASLIGRQVPAEDRVVGVDQEGYLFTDPVAVSKAYKEIIAEKNRRADGGKRPGKYITYIVYTKYGSRSFEVPDTVGNGLLLKTVLESGPDYETGTVEFPYEPTKAVIGYGYKPIMIGDMETKDYERLLKQIPEAYKKELPVYRVNFFGGLSLTEEMIVTEPDSIPEGSGYAVMMYLENPFSNSAGTITFLFPADPAVMRYYTEEIQAPKWKEIRELIKEADRYEIRLTFPPKEEDNTEPLWRFKNTKSLSYTHVRYKGGVCYGYMSRTLSGKMKLPEEETKQVEELLCLSGEVSYEGGEYVLAQCSVMCYSQRTESAMYEQEYKSILLALPKERVDRIFEQMKEVIPEEAE